MIISTLAEFLANVVDDSTVSRFKIMDIVRLLLDVKILFADNHSVVEKRGSYGCFTLLLPGEFS